jgi:hypothetical protein
MTAADTACRKTCATAAACCDTCATSAACCKTRASTACCETCTTTAACCQACASAACCQACTTTTACSQNTVAAIEAGQLHQQAKAPREPCGHGQRTHQYDGSPADITPWVSEIEQLLHGKPEAMPIEHKTHCIVQHKSYSNQLLSDSMRSMATARHAGMFKAHCHPKLSVTPQNLDTPHPPALHRPEGRDSTACASAASRSSCWTAQASLDTQDSSPAISCSTALGWGRTDSRRRSMQRQNDHFSGYASG